MHSLLKEIYQEKKRELGAIKKRLSSERDFPLLSFRRAIEAHEGIGLIAEIKKASPSKGLIREDFNPVHLAHLYSSLPAQAISVLTDQKYFQGHIDFLRKVKRETSLPVLRKDFIIDPLQVHEAWCYGADFILLIVAMLERGQMAELMAAAAERNLECLVEVHNHKELERALDYNTEIIGVNNRDLNTFEVDMNTALQLIREMPADIVKVAESGMSKREDIVKVEQAGFNAVLIGETLMRSDDIARTHKRLFSDDPD